MKTPYLYIRVIRQVTNTVFCVGDSDKTKGFGGQKKYWDDVFGKYLGYGSGSQVKRCIMERLMENLGEQLSPYTFVLQHKPKKNKLEEEVAFGTCNPANIDQLIGGFMKSGGNSCKRRSPLSISALKPVHSLLAHCWAESKTVNRSEGTDNKIEVIRVVNDKKEQLNDEEVAALFNDENFKPNFRHRKMINSTGRVSGIYEAQIAIDMEKLFTVNLFDLEPEITKEVSEFLQKEGWVISNNRLGKCLEAPEDYKKRVIEKLPDAILNWRIMTNQSSNFSLMPILAVSISKDAMQVNKPILAKLIRSKDMSGNEFEARLTFHEGVKEVDTYLTAKASEFILLEGELDFEAEEKAELRIKEELMEYCL